MATVVWNATVDDLYRVEGKAELVDGELVHMQANGDWHGIVTGNIFISLHAHVKQLGVGVAYGDSIVFLCDLPNRRSFSPDAAYYTGPRAKMKFLPQPPDFAVEIRGEDDYGPGAERRIARKRADYFAAGTKVVWDVDVADNLTIRVYRPEAPDTPIVFNTGMSADAEPAVPGWRFPVDELLS
ncbi:MAG: Uma2 family endonuclease [Planctomycetes bacterium]|nr:Uma2 family endonuclease [Planctomycetota bacterium]